MEENRYLEIHMKKEYDAVLTPQNTPHLTKQKILFVLTASMIVLNLIVLAFLTVEIRVWAWIAAGVFAISIPLQLLDTRKQQWTFWSMVLWILDLVIEAVLCVNFSGKTVFWWMLFAELAVLGIAACALFARIWKNESERKKKLQKRREKRSRK